MPEVRRAGTPTDSGSILPNANNVQINGGTFSVVRGDVHNHFHGGNDGSTAVWRVLQAIPNFRKIYQDMLSKATEGTGMWLLKNERFRVWLEPNGDIKIYWGSGMPGAGKTVLASIVIEQLEALCEASDAPICVCFVYFRYSDHADLTLQRILEILLKQTLERHPECRSLIEATYARHIRENTEPTESQLVTLLRRITDNMAITFYVLDSLDEAPPSIQLKVLRTLTSLNVKLFITSRPLEAVEGAFPEAHTFQILAQDQDIELHVDKGLSESPGLLNLLHIEGTWLREEILSTIKSKSSGMFLHASLQTEALRGCVTVNHVRRTLEGFPSQMEDVYLQTWSRILEESQESVLLAKAAFIWVLNASRSMTIDELERAVATSPETYSFERDRVAPRTTLIGLCRGLLVVEEESQLVRLVHYTAKESLQKLLEEPFPHPHSLLANVCMTHLTECGFQNTTIRSEDEFRATLEGDPLLAYASEAWPFHAQQSLGLDDINRRTACFVTDSSVFPAFTSEDRTYHFDILTPLHMVGLYSLPVGLVGDLETRNPNIATAVHQETPLMLASRSDFESLVKFLLADPEVQVNLVNDGGWSALTLIAQYGHDHLAALVLARPEIQVNLVDNDGWSPLMLTAQSGAEHIAMRLLTRPEIQVNLVNNEGWSALMLTAKHGHDEIATPLLARYEIQVNLVNNNGWSALMLTAQYGHDGIATLLLAHPEIQVNLISYNGWSALMLTAWYGHKHIAVRLLACPEIQVNLVDSQGWSALLIACYHGHEGVVNALLPSDDINVNSVNLSGYTTLMVAAQEGHESIVEILLLTPDIDPTIKAHEDEETAMSLALTNGHASVVKLLQEFELRNAIPSKSFDVEKESLDRDASESGSDTSESFYDPEDWPEEGVPLT